MLMEMELEEVVEAIKIKRVLRLIDKVVMHKVEIKKEVVIHKAGKMKEVVILMVANKKEEMKQKMRMNQAKTINRVVKLVKLIKG